MLNSPLLLVFESYSPALAESVCRQCVARKWATKAYCRPVMWHYKKRHSVTFGIIKLEISVKSLYSLPSKNPE